MRKLLQLISLGIYAYAGLIDATKHLDIIDIKIYLIITDCVDAYKSRWKRLNLGFLANHRHKQCYSILLQD